MAASKKAAKPTMVKSTNTTAPDYVVRGVNERALFSLTLYRGEGKCLLAMNWKQGMLPDNFSGFAIEYQPPGGTQFNILRNRVNFFAANGSFDPNRNSSRLSPIQKFRWIHSPSNPLPGLFTYRVTPVFMDDEGVLTYGDDQTAAIEVIAETYPGQLNICFNRGFIAAQAFVDRFGTNGSIEGIMPLFADKGLDFKPLYDNAEAAQAWMGAEARSVILYALDQAADDTSAMVQVAAFDLNDMEIVSRLQRLGNRLKIIIDDSGSHTSSATAENRAAALLAATVSGGNVQRQHMGNLQNNKMIVISGSKVRLAVVGSTNLSWRGLYVQSGHVLVLQGAEAVGIFTRAFDHLWQNANDPAGFSNTASAVWNDLRLTGIDAKVTFSPHNYSNTVLNSLAKDITTAASSLLYSLSFLNQTPGPIQEAMKKVVDNTSLFVYGISDNAVGGLNLQLPDGGPPTSFPAALLYNVPAPFKSETTGGSGARMHHKFVVIDFNKPTARVYSGSFNFSTTADAKNSENLFCIRDVRVATSYMVEAMMTIDHYEFRGALAKEKNSDKFLILQKPPKRGSKARPWWDIYWTDQGKIKDRELFGG